MTVLAFVFSVALISIDWPNSTHRGAFSAWCNHIGFLLMLLALMTTVCAVLDASTMVTRFMQRLEADIDAGIMTLRENTKEDCWKAPPMDDEVITLATSFRLVVRLGSAVMGLVYLPAVALLLWIPSRARIFDASTFPLSYVLLFAMAALLTTSCGLRLRRAAASIKGRIVEQLDDRVKSYEHDGAPTTPASTTGTNLPPQSIAWQELPRERQVELINEVRDDIQGERRGPFRLLAEDPFVRAILLLLGGTGAITTIQFLFLPG